jgi:hypothetical protein
MSSSSLKQYRIDNHLCLFCGSPNHPVNLCFPLRRKIQREQTQNTSPEEREILTDKQEPLQTNEEPQPPSSNKDDTYTMEEDPGNQSPHNGPHDATRANKHEHQRETTRIRLNQQRQKCWDQNLCLYCGSPEHHIAQCPHPSCMKRGEPRMNPSASTGRIPRIPPGERNYRHENNLCSYCGDQGHQNTTCPLTRGKKCRDNLRHLHNRA